MPISNTIVTRSLSLLRALSKEYGSEKTMEIWEELSGLIDDGDLKFEVFKLMLKGGYAGSHIEVQKFADSGANRVPAIRTLRMWTRCPLKSAVGAINDATNSITTKFPIAPIGSEMPESGDIPYQAMQNDFESVGLTIEFV